MVTAMNKKQPADAALTVSKPPANLRQAARQSGFSLDRLAEMYPELDSLKGVPQNPIYHAEGDVYTHTRMVCEQITSLPEWKRLPASWQELTFLAAAFHDIGKPSCTRLEDGAWVSPRHTIVGEKVFRRMAYREQPRFGLTFEERELIAKLIRYHGLPVWFWSKSRPEYELMKAAESLPLSLLHLLARADLQGRICGDGDRMQAQLELFWETAAEQGILDHTYPFYNAYSRYQYFHKEHMWEGAQLFDDTQFDVILLSGLPLSGKDTWIEKHGAGQTVISLDDIRAEFGIAPSDGSARVADLALKRAKGLLRQKQPFIWNATNLIQETRQRLVTLFSAYGARVHIRYLEVPYAELLRRNQTRNRHIPEKVLEEMICKLEVPAPWEAYEVEVRVPLH